MLSFLCQRKGHYIIVSVFTTPASTAAPSTVRPLQGKQSCSLVKVALLSSLIIVHHVTSLACLLGQQCGFVCRHRACWGTLHLLPGAESKGSTAPGSGQGTPLRISCSQATDPAAFHHGEALAICSACVSQALAASNSNQVCCE